METKLRIFMVLVGMIFLISGAFAYECWSDGTSAGALTWYTLDNADALTDVCGSYDMTNTTGAASGQTGWWDEAYQYAIASHEYTTDGDNDAITAAGDFSVRAIIYVSTTPAYHNPIISKSDGTASGSWFMWIRNAPKSLEFNVQNGAATCEADAGTVTAGNWYDVIGTFNATNQSARIYTNGTAIVDTNCGFASANANNINVIAGTLAGLGATHTFDGLIDEIALFNYTLTPTEAQNLFDYNNVSGVTPVTPGVYGESLNIYSSPVYESNETLFNYSVWTNNTNITTANATLNWNGTLFTPSGSGNITSGDNNTFWWEYENFTLPLVETNATNISTYFNYTLTWVNTTTSEHNGTNNTQMILHAYYWDDYFPDSDVLVGQTLNFYANITEELSTASWNAWALFNGTNYTLAGSANPYSNSTTAQNITSYNETFTSNATLNVSFTSDEVGTFTYERLSENETITIYQQSLTNCTFLSNTSALNFTFYDEPNLQALYSDMDVTFTIYSDPALTSSHQQSFNITNVTEYSFCIYPAWSTIYVDSFQVYQDNAEVYRIRNYFLTNATVTNSSTNVNLYNILTNESDLLTVTVEEDLVAQPDNYVRAERYYPAENLYRAVEIGRTDEDGQTFLYLVPDDVYYRFVVISNYSTVYSGDPREIGTSAITLDLSDSTTLEFFEMEDVEIDCNKTGDIIGCTIVNPTGLSIGALLLVKQVGIYSDTVICSTNVTDVTSTTLLCNTSGYSGTISAELMLLGSLYPAWMESFNGIGTNTYEEIGLYASLILVAGGALLLGASPTLAIIGALLGLVISALSGVYVISLASVIVTIVAGALILVRSRT